MIKKITEFDAIYSLVGGQITSAMDDGYTFHDGQTPPSEEEIETEIKRLQAEYDGLQYQRDREIDYPKIAEQLDEIYHNGIDSWKALVKQTKDKYPKP